MLKCSFCERTETNVRHLIKGNGAYICDSCVDECIEVLSPHKVHSATNIPSPQEEKEKKEPFPVKLNLTPEAIVKHLDDYVIGQSEAKRLMAVAMYNHYKRIGKKLDIEIQKSNVMMIGPSGVGKTLIAQNLAKLFDVPFAVCDATTLTEAGYVGSDVEEMLGRLIVNAGGDVKKAEQGIIYVDECFPPETEIMTERGFVKFEDLRKTDLVGQYTESGEIEFVAPERRVKRKCETGLYRIKSGFGIHISTPNHNRVLILPDGRLVKKQATTSLQTNARIPVHGKYNGPGIPLNDHEIRLLVAFMADGCIKNKVYGYIDIKKQRKIDRIDCLLENMEIKDFISKSPSSSKRLGYVSYYFGRYFESFLKKDSEGWLQKRFDKNWICQMSLRQRHVFLEEIKHWNGYIVPRSNSYQFFSSEKEEAEFVMAMAVTSGYSSHIHPRKKEGYRDNFAVSVTNKPFKTQQKISYEHLPYSGDVYCVTVPSGMILIRQNGFIQVSGNCDKISASDGNGRDVRGSGVQQSLLKMMEGSIVKVNPQGGKITPMSPTQDIDTTNILFIFSGAFSSLTDRVNLHKRSLGLAGNKPSLKSLVTPKDLVKFGMIPEFVGRIPIIAQLDPLNVDALLRILTEPKNAITKQYKALFSLDGCDIEYDPGFLKAVADKALKEGTGARGLRSILEQSLSDLMFSCPSKRLKKVTVTKDHIKIDQPEQGGMMGL